MFDNIKGNGTITATTVTDVSKKWITDYYLGWVVTIAGLGYIIKGNTKDTLTISDCVLSGDFDYTISFISRETLIKIDDSVSSTTKVSDELLNNKIELAKSEVGDKILSAYRVYFADYDDPLSLIYNLEKVSLPFSYLVLAKVFDDLSLAEGDHALFKRDQYLKDYTRMIKDKINLLTFDADTDGVLSGVEKSKSMAKQFYLSR